MSTDNVYIAFDILLEGIENVIEELNEKSKTAIEKESYDEAKKILEEAQKTYRIQRES